MYFAGNLTGLFSATPAVAAAGRPAGAGYGALVPDPAGLLDLPAGFKYRIVSKVGEALPGGGVVPGRFDGTAAYAGPNRSTILVRNHEQSTRGTKAVAAPNLTYDEAVWGGTTTVVLDKQGNKIDEYVSLAGTYNNCAGGLTPWGSWLTCEETEVRAGSGGRTKDHGFVFEVDALNRANNVNPTPLTALGRFPHEAAVIDPGTGIVYLTEDASNPNGLVYRCLPTNPSGRYGSLRAGGSLQAMRCTDEGTFVPDLSAYSVAGTTLTLGWVTVSDPLALTGGPTRLQLPQVTRSRKFEGAWWGNGAAYIVASYARGAADGSVGVHDGQVWRLDPAAGTLTLDVHFGFTPDQDVDPDGPDNITVSPYGGLLLAEDGEGVQYVQAVAPDGSVAPLARNARDEGEFAGVCFAPDNKTLFVNLQDPGVTFAITGPFARIRRSG